MDDAIEQQLLARARRGDKRAFDALQAVLERPVRGFVYRLIGYQLHVDDVVQDVFLAFYLNLARLDAREKVLPFLYRVARNRCYDILRRQGRYRVVSQDAPELVQSVEPSLPADERTHWSLLLVEVTQAIDRLPEAQRQTMILYAEENLTYDQIAEVMGTNVGTVKSRLHHARKLLRHLVKPETLAAIGS